MLELKTGCENTFFIDHEDLGVVSRMRWRVSSNGYVRSTDGILLHRFLVGAPKGFCVDHVNFNKMDNRRCNLRICRQVDNSRYQRSTKGAPFGLKGVRLRKDTGRWRARIMVNRREISLGCFDSKEDAARAYDAAALKYFGEFALTNDFTPATQEARS